MRELENFLESAYESTIAHGEQDKMPFVYTHESVNTLCTLLHAAIRNVEESRRPFIIINCLIVVQSPLTHLGDCEFE